MKRAREGSALNVHRRLIRYAVVVPATKLIDLATRRSTPTTMKQACVQPVVHDRRQPTRRDEPDDLRFQVHRVVGDVRRDRNLDGQRDVGFVLVTCRCFGHDDESNHSSRSRRHYSQVTST